MGNSLLKNSVTAPRFSCLIWNCYSSFIHSGYFYSASSSPLLLRGSPNYKHWYCVGVNTPKRYRQLREKDLPKAPMWRL